MSDYRDELAEVLKRSEAAQTSFEHTIGYHRVTARDILADGYRKLPLPVDSFPAHPTNSGRGNEQDRSNGSQPQQPLHYNTNHGQDQPKSKKNNHQGSHAQSLRPTPDKWNGAGIATEAR